MVPYSATQLYSYEVFKRAFAGRDGKLSVPARLSAGACAGMTATLAHPRPNPPCVHAELFLVPVSATRHRIEIWFAATLVWRLCDTMFFNAAFQGLSKGPGACVCNDFFA